MMMRYDSTSIGLISSKCVIFSVGCFGDGIDSEVSGVNRKILSADWC